MCKVKNVSPGSKVKVIDEISKSLEMATVAVSSMHKLLVPFFYSFKCQFQSLELKKNKKHMHNHIVRGL